MMMRYFRNPTNGVVYGYDDETQADYVAQCVAGGLVEVTAEWPPAPTLADLQARAIAAGQDSAASIVSQIFPDATRQAALMNAATIAAINNGPPPSSSPVYARFNALAANYGISPAALAAMTIAMQGASFDLSAAVNTLQSSVAAATTAAQIATAIAAFETSLASIIREIDAVTLGPVTPPSAIVIVGVNG